jgi:alanine racemase
MILINSKQLITNINIICSINNNNAKICIVLKMDAFGFGIENVMTICEMFDIYAYGITELDEIIKVRKYSIKPIICLKPITYETLEEHTKYNNIHEIVGSYNEIQNIIDINKKLNCSIPTWINIDSNLGRDGFIFNNNEEIHDLICFLIKNKINIVGIRTHHNEMPDDIDNIMEQFYNKALLFKNKFPNAIIHAACTYLYLNKSFNQKYNYDMVAIGAGIFSHSGRSLSEYNIIKKQKPLYCFKTTISHIKKVPPCTSFGYRNYYITNKDELIATLDMGWFNCINFAYNPNKQKKYIYINNKKYLIIACYANIINIIIDDTVSIKDTVYYYPNRDYLHDIVNLKNNKKEIY